MSLVTDAVCLVLRQKEGNKSEAVGPVSQGCLTIKYPPIQPVTTILITTATLALPNTLLTTVGIVEKNAPLAAPLMITNTIMDVSVVLVGHIARFVIEVRTRLATMVFRDPSLSDMTPLAMRPTADASENPATSPAPTLAGKPMLVVYMGMKKGGTKRGKVPMADPMKTRLKVSDLKSPLLKR